MIKLRTIANSGMALIIAANLSGCGSTPTKTPDTDLTPEITQDSQRSQITEKLSSADRSLLAASIQSLNDGKTQDALKKLKKLYKANPNNPAVAANYGVALYNIGSTKDALSLSKKYENTALGQNLLGTIALNEDRLADADSHFTSATQLDDAYPMAYYNLALIYETYYQDLKGAISLYNTYLKLVPLRDKETEQWVSELISSLPE